MSDGEEVAQTKASALSHKVHLSGSEVAETVTGTRNRKAKGFCEAAGEIEQHRQLQDVVAEEQRRIAVGEHQAAASAR